ncbi:serine/threonine protein kinase [Catalinimonas alkaloidigena]|uniref:Serine/threonine protein kinase n=1 Tax=Catalinimonas alkaloidigena TaxID=1075417 RepID=A0A1G8XCH0_9BACT|nr:serine/threonine-protein kinase [Catalinimonas alkaloidigena]SDJ88369.1 serine/threonine protein kinase [Catalinimonas alkaloidigena]
MMNAEQWQALQALYDTVLAMSGQERTRFLHDLQATRPAEAAALSQLLAESDEAFDFFDQLHLSLADVLSDKGTLNEADQVGAYRIVQPLGEGGMAMVYLAERADGQFAQRVALKILKRGIDTNNVLRRFHYERQILASLQHPHIARLYDGGVTDDGRPYFVMEYVEGQPLEAYCRERNLPLRARLELLITVCRALHYAHQNLVVHRDLKPMNLLVTHEGEVKLLDFGIAKLLREDRDQSLALTQEGHFLMTPDHAAPEQITGAPITTATDLYQLGLILYRLLTGHPAYELKQLSLSELEQAVVNREPLAPSRMVERHPVERHPVERHPVERHPVDAPHGITARQLRGDLDTIVLKALEKEPNRRYASAADLADDLERYLNQQPILARPQSLAYRTRKLVQRHTGAVVAGAAAVVALIGFTVFYTYNITKARTRAEQEAARARLEAAKAEQTTDFLTSLFIAGSPEEAQGDTLTAYDLLARGAQRARHFRTQPELQVQLLTTISAVYTNLSQLDSAQALLEEAMVVLDSLPEANPVLRAFHAHELGQLYTYAGQYPKAETYMRQAKALYEARIPNLTNQQDTLYLSALRNLAAVLSAQGNYEEAETTIRQVIGIEEERRADSTTEHVESLQTLASILQKQGQLQEAEALFRRLVALSRALVRGPHPAVASNLNSLGGNLVEQGKYREANEVYQQALPMVLELFGDTHMAVAIVTGMYGKTFYYLHQLDSAETRYQQSLAVAKSLFGEVHPLVAMRYNDLGTLHAQRGEYAQAQAYLQQALDVNAAVYPENHPAVAVTYASLGETALRAGDLPQAEKHTQTALRIREASLPPDYPLQAATRQQLAAVYRAQGRTVQADSLRTTLPDSLQTSADAL